MAEVNQRDINAEWTNEMEATALKRCFGDTVFVEFGNWYQNNMDRFSQDRYWEIMAEE